MSLSIDSACIFIAGCGNIAANLSIKDIDNSELEPCFTVAGSWHGSPSMTIERQLFEAVKGIEVAGSTLWHASSTTTKGKDIGGSPSGALRRVCCSPSPDLEVPNMPLLLFPVSFKRPSSLSESSSSFGRPHAARIRGSEAPVEVDTTTSASRRAFVAAMLHAYRIKCKKRYM